MEEKKFRLTIEDGYGTVASVESSADEIDADDACTMFLAAMTGVTFNTKMVLEHMKSFAEEELEMIKDEERISDSE